ncbi:TRAFAC clade GTPase domain-containing protein [Corynebacterium sp. A21]|uniref:TRAFAC clade GTPase domain-containing protein n=1 Tax=Corynebacterium sp. A21 TaxID=3457318 RepID=UPI003FD0B2E4
MTAPQNQMMHSDHGRLPTRCPYTFRIMDDPAAAQSPFLPTRMQEEFRLPKGWQNSGTITFAMAGARSSGKSLYIAVVVKLLKRLVVENGGTFRYADEHTKRIYEEKYQKPLFEQMGLLPPTPPAAAQDAHQQRPLIFAITTPQHAGQRIFVVFRDVAGEDLKEENFTERQAELDFFCYANRVIFLYDPMAVREIRKLLEGTVPSHEVGDDDPTAVLQNVLSVLGREHRPKISLCLSKFDTMQHLAEVNQDHFYGGGNRVNWPRVMSNYGATFRRDSAPLTEAFDRNTSALLDLEVRSLLSCLGATELLNQLNIPMMGTEPYFFSCFAVSALGAPPEGDRISRTGIAPFHCLDPVREVFAELGLFDGANSTVPFTSAPQQVAGGGLPPQVAHPGQQHYPAEPLPQARAQQSPAPQQPHPGQQNYEHQQDSPEPQYPQHQTAALPQQQQPRPTAPQPPREKKKRFRWF